MELPAQGVISGLSWVYALVTSFSYEAVQMCFLSFPQFLGLQRRYSREVEYELFKDVA